MRFNLLLWSLCCSIVANHALNGSPLNQSPPRLRRGPQTPILYTVGANVQLECPAYDEYTDLLFFEWSRDHNEQIEDSGRYKLTAKGVLKIKSAVVEDSGVYYCKAINGFGQVTANVTLEVVPNEQMRALHSPMDNLYPSDDNEYLMFDSNVNFKYNNNYKKSANKQLASEPSPTLELIKPVGVAVTFNCNARQVRWYKNGVLLHFRHLPIGSQRRNGMLLLSKVRVEDSGNYSCVAKDGLMNNTFQLYVFDNRNKKPELTAFHPINTTVLAGDTAMFQCRVSSEGKPHIQWLKDLIKVDKMDSNEAIKQGLIPFYGDYYRVLKSSQIVDSEDGIFYNKLLIEKTQVSDSGKYICLAANSIGYSYKIAHLVVIPSMSQMDGNGYTSTSQSYPKLIFWSSIACISILVIVLSLILYTKRNRPIEAFAVNAEIENKALNQTHEKQIVTNVNDWLRESPRMQANPAYSVSLSATNSTRQHLLNA